MNTDDVFFKTIYQNSKIELEIERSLFIAHAMPVENRDEADSFLREVRHKYKDATHNVPAMVIGDKMQIQWCSDDGEPSGTSGPPILQMLIKTELTNLIVIVSRYFGGIKLGTGGLVRAYTSAAKMALEAAGTAAILNMSKDIYTVEYAFFDKIKNREKLGDFTIEMVDYSDKITLEILTGTKNSDALYTEILNLTNGTAVKESSKNATM